MKKIITIFTAVLLTANVFAQAPQKMSYQAVIRNGSNALITNSNVGMQISILQGSSTGTVVYMETQTPSTNANGLVSLEIGTGTIVIGTFAGINWANGPYFIKTETDPTGGTTYTISGTNQLMSVPYALFAANSLVGPIGGFTHYLGEDFNDGIIFYLYKGSDGLEHGLIVSKTESTAVWQASGVLVNADRTEDGAYNTALMTNSAAAIYIATLGAGWYLPSIDELGLLYHNRYSAQKGLRAGGFTLLSTGGAYWSSTEFGILNPADAYAFFFFNASTLNIDKNTTYEVRGVRAF